MMTDTSDLTFIAASVGIELTRLLFSLPGRQNNRYFWQRPGNCLTWVGMSLLLMIFSACSGSLTTSTSQTTPIITPLALTATAQAESNAKRGIYKEHRLDHVSS